MQFSMYNLQNLISQTLKIKQHTNKQQMPVDFNTWIDFKNKN